MRKLFAALICVILIVSIIPSAFADDSDTGWYLPDINSISLEAVPLGFDRVAACDHVEINQVFRVRYDPAMMHVDPVEYIHSCFTLDVWVIDNTTGCYVLMDGVIEHWFYHYSVDMEHREMVFTIPIRLDTSDMVGHSFSIMAELTLDGGEDDPVYTEWRSCSGPITVGLLQIETPVFKIPARPIIIITPVRPRTAVR